jgi:hypothetical protein
VIPAKLIRIETACGCTRYAPAGGLWDLDRVVVPLASSVVSSNYWNWDPKPPLFPDPLRTRTFQFDHTERFHEDLIRVFKEVV